MPDDPVLSLLGKIREQLDNVMEMVRSEKLRGDASMLAMTEKEGHRGE